MHAGIRVHCYHLFFLFDILAGEHRLHAHRIVCFCDTIARFKKKIRGIVKVKAESRSSNGKDIIRHFVVLSPLPCVSNRN